MINPEAPIRVLGKEIDPGYVGLGGFFLTMAGVFAANVPCLAVPAIIVGLGMMEYSDRKMGQQDKQTSSRQA